jgi:glycerophosphoryl diester phosphodiesterase
MALIIAHRGAWKKLGLPQNSIASLRQASALGCDGAEFDVRLTADGVLVVNHDADFYGLDIEKSTYRELLKARHSNGETIPTLEEYLSAGVKSPNLKLILEIKSSSAGSSRTKEIAEKSVVKVQELQAQQVEYISFDYDALRTVRVCDAAARVAYLGGDKSPAQLQADGFFGADYPHEIFHIYPAWIKEAHALGLTVNAWTVNDATGMKRLLEAGADYITTDEPELLREIIAQ